MHRCELVIGGAIQDVLRFRQMRIVGHGCCGEDTDSNRLVIWTGTKLDRFRPVNCPEIDQQHPKGRRGVRLPSRTTAPTATAQAATMPRIKSSIAIRFDSHCVVCVVRIADMSFP
jgi:hypothetical protein